MRAGGLGSFFLEVIEFGGVRGGTCRFCCCNHERSVLKLTKDCFLVFDLINRKTYKEQVGIISTCKLF